VFWCDRKTAIERDSAAIVSDQTKFKVAEGRSTVAVRCDWALTNLSRSLKLLKASSFWESKFRLQIYKRLEVYSADDSTVVIEPKDRLVIYLFFYFYL